jgi:peptidoglycan/xylan/chitin deacetylase (PgdA/CDA1 family)
VSLDFKSSSRERDYVHRFLTDCLGIKLALNEIEPSLAETCFHELTRREEIDNIWRDQWGNWDWPFGEAHRRGELYTPRLDRILTDLRRQLPQRPRKEAMPLWPDGKSFALCLTHDVDEINPRHSARNGWRRAALTRRTDGGWSKTIRTFARSMYDTATSPEPSAKSPSRTIDDWLELEDHYGYKSTFFIFPDRPPHPHQWDCTYRFADRMTFKANRITLAEAMREIDRYGWEIGLHGSYSSATEPDLLENEKSQIENAIDKPVTSVRQHYLHYDIRRTPGLQASAGLRIDSTLGFNRSVGFRAGTCFPFWCWDHEARSLLKLLEVPQIIMDSALFSPGSLEYNEDLAIEHCLQLMETVRQVGGCLTLNWHQDNINDDRYWQVYRTLLAEASGRGAWGCSLKMLYDSWVAREETLTAREEARPISP